MFAKSFLKVFVCGMCLLRVCFGVVWVVCFVLDFLCHSGLEGGGGGSLFLFVFFWLVLLLVGWLVVYWSISFWL